MKKLVIVFGMLAGTACHHTPNPPPTDAGDKIQCALGTSAKMAEECSVERTASSEGELILILHHPDGGFRLLAVTKDGRGVIAADGADVASVTPLDNHEIEVVVGDDRYHLPATVKP
jgi:hypothetical protein